MVILQRSEVSRGAKRTQKPPIFRGPTPRRTALDGPRCQHLLLVSVDDEHGFNRRLRVPPADPGHQVDQTQRVERLYADPTMV